MRSGETLIRTMRFTSMEKSVYDDLLRWKRSGDRKPLLLEGIKQSGRTFLLRYLGEKNYEDTAYFNFRDAPELSDIFDKDPDPKRIVRELASMRSKDIGPARTLIILDEIQFCNRALASMRSFCDDAPEYHVACGGSMGMMLSDPGAFPVGKVVRMRIGPKDFKDFLAAEQIEEESYC